MVKCATKHKHRAADQTNQHTHLKVLQEMFEDDLRVKPRDTHSDGFCARQYCYAFVTT